MTKNILTIQSGLAVVVANYLKGDECREMESNGLLVMGLSTPLTQLKTLEHQADIITLKLTAMATKPLPFITVRNVGRRSSQQGLGVVTWHRT